MTQSQGAKAPAEPRLAPGLFSLTDSGNAERFMARNKGNVRYCVPRRRWLTWESQRWQWDESGEAHRLVKETVRGIRVESKATGNLDLRKALEEWSHKSESSGKRAAVEELARYESGVPVNVDELDTDPWLLNCTNGTVDLRTGALLPHSREHMITKCTGVAYRPGAESPVWDSVLAKMTGGDTELEGYLRRVAGYALTGLAREKKFFFLYGPRDSGKSSYINALHAAMGDYARSTPFETWTERRDAGNNRDDLVALQGVRLVTSGEVSQTARWNTALVKQITGGDRISASRKFESMIEFRPMCTIILAANDSPKARDDDDGFWGRMQRVPISSVIPKSEQLTNFLEVISSAPVAESILAWAIAGCIEWQGVGIGTAKCVQASSDAYREEQDWLGGFLATYVEDDAAVIPAPVFRDQYERYCKQEGQLSEPTKTLATRITRRLPGVRYRMLHGRREWTGLRLRDGAYAQQLDTPQGATPAPAAPPKPREPEQRSLGFTPDPDDLEPPPGRFDDDDQY